MKVKLRGITWNHTRGFLPMVATAQRFEETHPDVEIVWEKRSLREFSELTVEELQRFDFLVIDYSFVGGGVESGCLLSLNDYLPGDFLADLAAHSVGSSHASYSYRGRQWALAADTAAPVASWRPDLIERLRLELPRTWDELLELARRRLVALPGAAVDCLMHFFMLCLAHGEEPLSSPLRVVAEEVGVAALDDLRLLLSLCSPQCLECNPIAIYEAMSSRDEIAYCASAFGYSNYARPHYAPRALQFGKMVSFVDGKPLRSSLGGAGLSISSSCQHATLAAEYARFVADPDCQCSLFFASGGQPGYRTAWKDPVVNEASNHFFLDTLETLDRSWVRPNYNGYIPFQNQSGQIIHRFLRQGGDPRAALAEMEELYRHERY